MKQGLSLRADNGRRVADARTEPLAVCGACGWRADEPPGACVTPLCGLRDAIHARRNETRAKLGLPAMPRAVSAAKRSREARE